MPEITDRLRRLLAEEDEEARLREVQSDQLDTQLDDALIHWRGREDARIADLPGDKQTPARRDLKVIGDALEGHLGTLKQQTGTLLRKIRTDKKTVTDSELVDLLEAEGAMRKAAPGIDAMLPRVYSSVVRASRSLEIDQNVDWLLKQFQQKGASNLTDPEIRSYVRIIADKMDEEGGDLTRMDRRYEGILNFLLDLLGVPKPTRGVGVAPHISYRAAATALG